MISVCVCVWEDVQNKPLKPFYCTEGLNTVMLTVLRWTSGSSVQTCKKASELLLFSSRFFSFYFILSVLFSSLSLSLLHLFFSLHLTFSGLVSSFTSCLLFSSNLVSPLLVSSFLISQFRFFWSYLFSSLVSSLSSYLAFPHHCHAFLFSSHLVSVLTSLLLIS